MGSGGAVLHVPSGTAQDKGWGGRVKKFFYSPPLSCAVPKVRAGLPGFFPFEVVEKKIFLYVPPRKNFEFFRGGTYKKSSPVTNSTGYSCTRRGRGLRRARGGGIKKFM